MAKIETITSMHEQNGAQVQQAAENYTSINGIYGDVITPQFSSAKDNVHQLPIELLKAEEAYAQQQELRFFTIR
jgi:hypothetical protein